MQLFRFANPDFFYLLLVVPVLILLWVINSLRRKKALHRFGEESLVAKLTPEASKFRPVIKLIIQLIALLSGIIMLARPQFGSKLENVKKEGVEIIIALDVSNSMLSEDIQPNRLERAKQSISRLIDQFDDDKIGLIVFAGDAYTQIPVTNDYLSAKMFLSTVGPDMVSKQGTAIGAAIDLGIRSFSPNLKESKALIIISDGENHEDDPVAKAKEAADAGIVIHTIGIGSADGSPIPITTDGKKDFLKDVDGNTVISRLDENILKEIALATNGKFTRATNTNIGLNDIFNDIKKMTTQEMEGTIYTEYNDQFQFFAAAMIIFLLVDFLIMERKNKKLLNIRFFKLKI
jgi:Ca-activated chloride channel family protein